MYITSLRKLVVILAALPILCSCSKEDDSPWFIKIPCEDHITIRHIYDLLEPAGDYDIKKLSSSCMALYVPREGGRFTFNLSKDAYFEEKCDGKRSITQLDSYILYKFTTFEVTYASGNIPEDWPLWPVDYYKYGAFASNIVENGQSTYDAGWGTAWGGLAPNSITFDILPNEQDRTRQYCIWYGKYANEIPTEYYPYALVIFQK